MKKVLVFLVVVVLLISQFGVTSFAVEDITPPELTSVSQNMTSFYGGDKLKLNVAGTDDVSGIKIVQIEYRLKTDTSKKLTVEFQNKSASNSFSYSYTLPTNIQPGEWDASVIQVWDVADNLNTYVPGSANYGNPISFKNLKFVILDSGKDFTPPVLNSIKLVKSKISAPGNIEVVANITDNASSTVTVQVTYDICGSQTGFELNKTGKNTYTGSCAISADAKYHPVELAYIVLTDDAGNQAWYSYNPAKYPFGATSLKLSTNIDVKITNSVKDNTPPTLTDYSYSTNKVEAPGSFKVYVNATDNISGIAEVNCDFVGVYADGTSADYLILNCSYDSTKKCFVSTCTFSQYEGAATYSITKVTLTDKAGNKSIYSINPQANEKRITEKKIDLVKAVTGDVNTGTMTDNYIDKIANAKDDAIITLDCTNNSIVPKEAFDKIKNTNKTLILENDGIQWIFKGSDIINATKDIDTRVKVYQLDPKGNQNIVNYFTITESEIAAVVVEFPPNGLLPGLAHVKIKADYTLMNLIGVNNLFVYYYQDGGDALKTQVTPTVDTHSDTPTDNTVFLYGLEAVADNISISSNGNFEFNIAHNSKYIITSKKAKTSAIVKDTTVQLKNTTKNATSNTSPTTSIADPSNSIVPKNSNKVTSDEKRIGSYNSYFLIIILVFIIAIVSLGYVFRKQIFRLLKKYFKKE